jgi:hypothetical protein
MWEYSTLLICFLFWTFWWLWWWCRWWLWCLTTFCPKHRNIFPSQLPFRFLLSYKFLLQAIIPLLLCLVQPLVCKIEWFENLASTGNRQNNRISTSLNSMKWVALKKWSRVSGEFCTIKYKVSHFVLYKCFVTGFNQNIVQCGTFP